MDLIGPGVAPASDDTAGADGEPRRVVPCRERGYRVAFTTAGGRPPPVPPSRRIVARFGAAIIVSGTPCVVRRARVRDDDAGRPDTGLHPSETERARDERSIGNEH